MKFGLYTKDGSTPKTGASDPPPEKYAIEKFVFLT